MSGSTGHERGRRIDEGLTHQKHCRCDLDIGIRLLHGLAAALQLVSKSEKHHLCI